jgi:integrase/recombinase XerD
MNQQFCGPLAAAIERHLRLRHSLGFIYRGAASTLSSFDRYLAQHFPTTQTVTRPMVEGFLETSRHLAPKTRAQHLSDLRQFCRFLFQQDSTAYVPETGLLPPAKTVCRPHLYSPDELMQLIRLAKQLPPAGSLRPWTYATLIGLLWVTGLRIGEALRLNLEDVDLNQGLLVIQQTKNFKSRLIPLTTSTIQALRDYRERRSSYGHDQRATAPFFVNERARRCVRRTVESTFLAMTRHLNLKTAQGLSPRLHDFRHAFATRSLARFYQSGQEPAAYLPVLATYLGHTNITDTEVYLHPQLDLLETAGERFRTHIREIGNLTLGGPDEGL